MEDTNREKMEQSTFADQRQGTGSQVYKKEQVNRQEKDDSADEGASSSQRWK